MATSTSTTTGTWTCPNGVYSVIAECWGAGGGTPAALSSNTTGGGGGGAYAKKVVTTVPTTVYTVTVGAGTTGIGGDSWFSTSGTILAKGGTVSTTANPTGSKGTGGVAGSCIGD